MAELMRKFFEMNDMDVLIIGILYFGSVIVGMVYCIRKWIKEDKEKKNDKKRQSGSNHRHGRQARR